MAVRVIAPDGSMREVKRKNFAPVDPLEGTKLYQIAIMVEISWTKEGTHQIEASFGTHSQRTDYIVQQGPSGVETAIEMARPTRVM